MKQTLTPIRCSCCGKRIVKGNAIYKVRGLTYQCCSAKCMLDCVAVYYVEKSTGYEETQDESKKR